MAVFQATLVNQFPSHLFLHLFQNRIFGDNMVKQELIRRWDSECELLHSAPQKLSEFAEIMQNNGHYAVQGHSRSPILVPIESSYTISY